MRAARSVLGDRSYALLSPTLQARPSLQPKAKGGPKVEPSPTKTPSRSRSADRRCAADRLAPNHRGRSRPGADGLLPGAAKQQGPGRAKQGNASATAKQGNASAAGEPAPAKRVKQRREEEQRREKALDATFKAEQAKVEQETTFDNDGGEWGGVEWGT